MSEYLTYGREDIDNINNTTILDVTINYLIETKIFNAQLFLCSLDVMPLALMLHLKFIFLLLLFFFVIHIFRLYFSFYLYMSISVLLTKTWLSCFLKRVCVFQKICFKVKELKTSLLNYVSHASLRLHAFVPPHLVCFTCLHALRGFCAWRAFVSYPLSRLRALLALLTCFIFAHLLDTSYAPYIRAYLSYLRALKSFQNGFVLHKKFPFSKD